MKNPWWVLSLTLPLVLLSLGAIASAPVDSFQGVIQKIFYIHVTAAWLAFLGSFLCAFFSAFYLIRPEEVFDRRARPFAELSLLFTSQVLVTGPFWAKPVWGTYWTWDPRLTSTFILWLLFCSYFLARATIPDAKRRRQIAAVIAILGALDVPFVHLSVLLFRTLHPAPVVLNPKGLGKNLDPRMLRVLLFTLSSFTLLFFNLYAIRARQLRQKSCTT